MAAILDETLPPEVTLFDLASGMPLWEKRWTPLSARGWSRTPNGETVKPRPWDTTTTPLQLALARGYRWQAMLESGEAKSLKEIAAREGIDNSYVSRMVNLTTLAPDIVAAILDQTTSRCSIWRLIRQRCGSSSGQG